jgi:uncharacterized protein YjiS (DUF1127 family)
VEIIMSTIPLVARQSSTDGQASGLAATLKRSWLAYIRWRIEQAGIAELRSMSDLELKDIGLTRTEITSAVRSEAARHCSFSRYY